MTTAQKKYTWLAIILLLATGLIHALDAPDSFEEAAYKGWLFWANAAGALVAAFGIYRKRGWGWWLGLVIASVSLCLYITSRTAGLPLIPAEPDEWFEPLGVLSLIAEAGFVVVWIRNGRYLK